MCELWQIYNETLSFTPSFNKQKVELVCLNIYRQLSVFPNNSVSFQITLSIYEAENWHVLLHDQYISNTAFQISVDVSLISEIQNARFSPSRR